jgi:hypothetical protein
MLGDAVKILFIAGFAPIVRDAAPTRKLYIDDLGILFTEEVGGNLHTETLQGANTFALWPLSEAAQSCFDSVSWPSDVPVPQAWIEFEVDSVGDSTAALERRGHRILVKNKASASGARSIASTWPRMRRTRASRRCLSRMV